jgi:hypothetical protein
MNMNDDDAGIAVSSWLARAREQSRALADARAGRLRPFRKAVPASADARPVARPTVGWAFAALLILVLVGSGAWALVRRVRHEPPPPSRQIQEAPPRPMILRTPAAIATTPAPAAPKPSASNHRRSKPPVPPEPESANVSQSKPGAPAELERGEYEDIIVVPRHERLPPLFVPDEWKQQH